MKKLIIVGIILLFVGASVIPSMGNPIVVRHDLQENKATFKGINSRGYIQDLIDNASDGDTIYIPSGIYYENIIINKAINLIGEDKDTTIIDGGGIDDVVKITGDWVNISGFTIQKGGKWDDAGIHISSNYNTILGNIITLNDAGIHLEYSSNNTLKNNNIVSNNNYGIYLKYSSGTIIKDNTFFNNGLYIDRAYHNTFENNWVNGKPLVYLEDVSNQVITDAGEVILINCNKITVEKLNLSNVDIGIQLLETNNCNIWDNDFSNDGVGIMLEDSNHNTITGNTIASNNIGVEVCGSNFNTFTDNTILDNEYGIYLSLSHPPSLAPSRFNILKGNNISNNRHGIWFIDTTCSLIFKNNFIGNEQDTFFSHHIIFYSVSRNRWGGNYWGKPHLLPKPIFGQVYWYQGYPRPRLVSIEWIQFDWRPALKPYDI